MKRLSVGVGGWLMSLVLGSITGSAHGAAFPYVSCVGKEWMALKANVESNGKACVRNDSTKVCREPVKDAGNATSKVTVSQGGHLVLDWLESGDPSYLSRMLAFSSGHGELVVATLQSESQGMAMRDWNVAYIAPSGVDTPDVLHARTAEFGAEGSIVKPARARTGRCALLVSEWKSLQTQEGERLFLSAHLRSLSTAGFDSPSQLPADVRFDDQVKKLREQDDVRIPLIFFDGRASSR